MTDVPEQVASWLATRSWDAARDVDADGVRAAVARHRVTVLVPALDEEATVGDVVEGVRRSGLVDELVVVDGGSLDGTAGVAAAAGATVLHVDHVEPQRDGRGKGAAVWRGLLRTTGDLVVLLDADVAPFDDTVLPALLAPLVLVPEVQLVKAAATRPLVVGGVSHPGAGGRVTELVARPLLNALWPELAGFAQPLSGELAARRALLERLPMPTGYGLEIALLLDAYRLVGAAGLAQVVLGERVHRHQPDVALGRMAAAVLRAALTRAGHADLPASLVQFARDDAGRLVASTAEVGDEELPPVAQAR